MRISVYYNDHDKDAAQWLRNLIQAGLIPAGDVDERSVVDVQPGDLRGYRHVHLFAGIGGWALAAALAGWPAERELWSASCPCQPWSVAGRRRGRDDARDLWSHLVRLIRARRPAIVVGEQVATAIGYAWFDRVSTDLEREHYSSRAVDLAALAVNAPQCRQRLYWIAVANPLRAGLERPRLFDGSRATTSIEPADANAVGAADRGDGAQRSAVGKGWRGWAGRNPWSNARFITCADGRRRRSEPGIRWWVDGFSAGLVEIGSGSARGGGETAAVKRVALWKGYGNAIVPHLAAELLAAVIDIS